MKRITLAASAALLILSSPVWAQTQVTLTGSTALRSVIQDGITVLLGGKGKFEGDNVDFKRANAGRWTGKFGGKNIEIKLSWTGSYTGVKSVAGSEQIKFVADSTPTKNPNTDSTAAFELKVPDIAVSDVFQASTAFNGTVGGVTYAKLDDSLVAAQIFQWLASAELPTGVDNLTSLQAQQLYTSGRVPLSLLTGKSKDRNKSIFALGRNPGSGTRGVALADSATGSNTRVKQWQPSITGQAPNAAGTNVGGHVTSQVLWPIETIDGISTGALGNSGFSSGSGVAAALTATIDPTPAAGQIGNSKATAAFYIGYLGLSDIATATGDGAKTLKWNGVAFSNKNVTEGTYSFWSYAHIMSRSNLNAEAEAFAEALINQVRSVEVPKSSTLVEISKMQVRRTADGGPVFPRVQ